MSTNPKARAWVQVRADALLDNYARITESVGAEVRVLPMVKADAYGLGMLPVARCLEPLDPWGFGVATVSEGIELRDAGIDRRVVICSPIPADEIEAAVVAGLEISVSSLDTLEFVTASARAASRVASIHVDVDTGMGRSGFDWRTAAEWLPAVSDRGPDVRWIGCYTHLHSADEDRATIETQWARLTSVLEQLPDRSGLIVHVLNSAGAFRAGEYAQALVRPGIFLYGGGVGPNQPSPEPVVSVHARIVHVREVQPGTTLGYGATYRAEEGERWATLSIGYGDGYPRSLGNRGRALVCGRLVPIIGRISMDVTVVNITDVPDVSVGDVATLVGSDGQGAIALDDVATVAGTISYEVLTGLTRRLPRVWQGAGMKG
jgi:alanine racemase